MQGITVLKITTYAFVHSCLFLSDFAVHWTDNFQTLSLSKIIITTKVATQKKHIELSKEPKSQETPKLQKPNHSLLVQSLGSNFFF